MDAYRAKLNNPKIAGIAGLVVGLLLGLIFAWGIWPVQYYDAAPQHLQKDYRADYLKMAIDAYATHLKTDQANAESLAKMRWAGLEKTAEETWSAVEKDPGKLDPKAINDFKSFVTGKPVETGIEAPGAETPAEESKGTNIWVVIIVMCVITLLVGGGVIAVVLLSGGKRGSGVVTPAMQAREAAKQATMTDYAAKGEDLPVAQFMASYKLGDDLFDESFSIDAQNGEFLGECGVGISEPIGVGEPKKVTAFEIWLFDKNDIQTVTKVIMSPHAFGDEALRQRLSAKGEPVEAKVGNQVVLETATLQLVARVVEMTYGEGALPPESFFDQLLLELAIWKK